MFIVIGFLAGVDAETLDIHKTLGKSIG